MNKYGRQACRSALQVGELNTNKLKIGDRVVLTTTTENGRIKRIVGTIVETAIRWVRIAVNAKSGSYYRCAAYSDVVLF